MSERIKEMVVKRAERRRHVLHTHTSGAGAWCLQMVTAALAAVSGQSETKKRARKIAIEGEGGATAAVGLDLSGIKAWRERR